jgi:hypothetical protein
MKTVKITALVAVLMAIVVFAGCKSQSQPAPGINLQSTAQVETIEHQGTALGLTSVPPWLAEYVQRNGTRSVEALPDYKNFYVIVGVEFGPDLQQVLTWANNFNAQQQIGATINTRVASIFKAHESLLPGEDEAQRRYSNAINTLVTASYTGARKENQWWVHQRVTEGKETYTRYAVYVLYTIEKNILNDQIKNQISQLKDGNPELGAAFDAVKEKKKKKGLEWD